ncbi:hypothetical protein OIU41_11655 [Lacticaseibacillus paracasei]|uniref:hypothetical protein n=1 Tax=Lacticaseibacillus paracasei TaxID=1597 RepID=UPI0033930CD9
MTFNSSVADTINSFVQSESSKPGSSIRFEYDKVKDVIDTVDVLNIQHPNWNLRVDQYYDGVHVSR